MNTLRPDGTGVVRLPRWCNEFPVPAADHDATARALNESYNARDWDSEKLSRGRQGPSRAELGLVSGMATEVRAINAVGRVCRGQLPDHSGLPVKE